MKTDKRGPEREDAHAPLKGVANFLFEVGMLKNRSEEHTSELQSH